jgi:hypothetical protein
VTVTFPNSWDGPLDVVCRYKEVSRTSRLVGPR